MANQKAGVVFDNTGLQGIVEERFASTTADEQVLITFAPSQQVKVPLSLLTLRKDGSYFLPLSVHELTGNGATSTVEQQTIPIIEEELQIHKRVVETEKIRVTKTVQSNQQLVDIALMAEELEVKRVPINHVVDGPLAVRTEGDTIIVPLVEEVVMVQKQLWLKEEIHITRRQTARRYSEQVTLQSEAAVVEHLTQHAVNTPLE